MKVKLYDQIIEFNYETTPTRYVDCDIFVFDEVLDFDYNLSFTAGPYPLYEGPYVVEPQLYDQTLETAHKGMSDNVLVKEVPVQTTANPNGGYTLSIMS